MTKIRDLTPGTRFRYEFGRTATLVSVGDSGARIKYDSDARHAAFVAVTGEGEKPVEFDAPGRAVLVSSYSDVEVIP